ncbi:hypothetical protein Ani05nite_72150 [Amorphoplanes nipponensis]|uniref:Uncharacterized protein n=1 Tax=Actinoplanes nipponensis TaxID=135950 RepID=A0A919JN46_9ACTN|nr:hypothetical protein [Actinoplanes nipponensis]GIE53681.1 hypothetical protein Ani05nite_72150 [Actinoplanes nipponensis]
MAQSFTTTINRGSDAPRTVGRTALAGAIRVPDGAVRWVVLAHARDLLRQARARWILETVSVDGDYRQLRGTEPAEALTLDESYAELTAECGRLAEDFPDRCGPAAGAVRRLAVVLAPAATVAEVWAAHTELLGVLEPGGGDTGDCTVTPLDGALEIRLGGAGRGPAAELDTAAFLARVRRLAGAARREGRRPSAAQLVAERFAFDALSRGAGSVRHWGTSGFRDHQTYMSVTDPGEGHLDGTVRSLANLDGVIVHIEHLERGGHQDRRQVEPYRIPDPQTVRQVRLLVGDDAPVSSYVGRPVFEGAVEPSMLKTARTVAAACSELFAQGLAECKIAIEGMTARGAVKFMRAVRAGVARDRFTQVLSAAFNLNTPLLDDRAGQLHDARLVTGRLDIGLLGVELARAGGFDKVTWDGTADTYPSRCVLEQLSYAEAVTLVHRAHERGLLTYFSAGFRRHHLAQAVLTGVDGIGVGGAQILRYMDADTGFHGPFLDRHIPAILAERDLAETSVLGQAARTLSRLDRMAYEGTLTAWDDVHRRDLFAALTAGRPDLGELRRLLGAVAHVTALPDDTEHPLVGWAGRLLAGGHHTLAATSTRLRSDWQAHLDRVAEARDHDDLDRLELLLAAGGGFAAASPRSRREPAAGQALAA